MSLTFESPTHRMNGASEAYFTPLSMPSVINNTNSNNNTNTTEEPVSNTPYYTAPINPGLHQDFLNAIQARHSAQPTVLTGVSSPMVENTGFSLNMGSPLANRRQPIHNNTTTTTTAASSHLKPVDSDELKDILTKYKDKENLLIVLDVRSFVQFSHSKIRGAINVSIPNTILKRPTFTLEKVYEAIVLESAREKLKRWSTAECIVFYDQQSQILQENTASSYLGAKLIRAGFKGQLNYLKGNTTYNVIYIECTLKKKVFFLCRWF